MIGLLIIGLQRKKQVGACGDSVVHGKMVARRRRIYCVIVCICVLDLTSSPTHATDLNISAGRPLSRGHAGRSQQGAPPLIQTLQALKTTSLQNAAPLCNQHSAQSSCLPSTDPEIDFFLNATNSSGVKQHSADQDGGASKSYKRTSHFGREQPTSHQSRIHLPSVHDAKTSPVRP